MDKKAIYNHEKSLLIQWFKTITGTTVMQFASSAEGKLRNVKALATIYVMKKQVESVRSLLEEFNDGEGHIAIHFAANRGYVDICEWILQEYPECVGTELLGSRPSWKRSMKWVILPSRTPAWATRSRE